MPQVFSQDKYLRDLSFSCRRVDIFACREIPSA